MALKQDISEKLGLDWLGTSSRTEAQSGSTRTGPPGLPAGAEVDAIRAIVGKQILGVLKDAHDKTDNVYNLVDRLRLDISTVLTVVDYLESTGFIEVTRDDYGNHIVRLTKAGEAWVS